MPVPCLAWHVNRISNRQAQHFLSRADQGSRAKTSCKRELADRDAISNKSFRHFAEPAAEGSAGEIEQPAGHALADSAQLIESPITSSERCGGRVSDAASFRVPELLLQFDPAVIIVALQ